MPNVEHRDSILAHLLSSPSSHKEMQDYTIAAKRVIDLYLVIVANRLWDKKVAEAMKEED